MKTSSLNIDSPVIDRRRLFITLMGSTSGGANAGFIASMLASWYAGAGVLPARMGLAPEAFKAMVDCFFPGVELPPAPHKPDNWLDAMPEHGELAALFADLAIDERPERQWIGAMIIAGCTGHHHLWEDLGLFSRTDLTAMIQLNFPELAQANSRDMKWKKFIYKQLCDREGIYACPAPTCDACADFKVCFAPEDRPSRELANT